MKLSDLLSRNAIVSELAGKTKEGVLEELSGLIARAYPELDKNKIATALFEREKLGSTGIENGVAIPHAKLRDLDRIIIAAGRSREGVDFQAHDGKASHLFFVLLAPDSSAGAHLKTLARLARLLKEDHMRNRLMEAKDSEEIYNMVAEGDDKLPC